MQFRVLCILDNYCGLKCREMKTGCKYNIYIILKLHFLAPIVSGRQELLYEEDKSKQANKQTKKNTGLNNFFSRPPYF